MQEKVKKKNVPIIFSTEFIDFYRPFLTTMGAGDKKVAHSFF